jgi:hypothetical protein
MIKKNKKFRLSCGRHFPQVYFEGKLQRFTQNHSKENHEAVQFGQQSGQLASAAGKYITGRTIMADGGMMIR